jgi:hypothetical protein
MNLVKWIRKNNRKIMVFVVIFCMVSFVIGSFGIKIIVSMLGGGSNQLIGTYDGGKIKTRQFIQAQNELNVLRMLMADRLLMAQGSQGLGGPLLVHLLFSDSPFAGDVASELQQAVRGGQLNLSQEDLDSYFNQQPQRAEIVWILLNQEARRTGYILPIENARETLRSVVPPLTNNQLDAAQLVNQIISKNNIEEERILRIFADLMGVMAYAGQVSDSEDVTLNQVRASLGRSKERIDANFVEIPAAWFVDPNAAVSEADMQRQFETYKDTPPNVLTPQNPFGFGYKLGQRVQMDYMVVDLDAVKKLIEIPTPEAIESYYSRNLSQFQTSKPSDPNNPESEKITETRPFAEVEGVIRRTLENERTLSQATLIFNDIKSQTEAGFETLNMEEATVDQIQQAAGDYQAVARSLSEKYGIAITAGKTGWFSAETLAGDEVLSSLTLQRQGGPLRLADMVFAVTREKAKQARIGLPSIRVWENIGPLTGGIFDSEANAYHRLMALVRVVGIQDAQTPESIDFEFATQGMTLFKKPSEAASTFRLKDKIKEDLQLVQAMDTAKTRAEELAGLAKEKGWDEAVKAYNAAYAKTPADPNRIIETGAVEVAGIKQQLRISAMEIEMAKRIMLENPASAQFIQRRLVSNMLTNKLYALLPENAESTGIIQTVLPFEPTAAYYVVQSVVRQPATEKDYLDNKARTALQLSAIHSAGLPLVHFNAANLFKRMGYVPSATPEELLQKTQPEQMPMPDDVL